MWHGYFGIENLALSDQQRGLLVDVLRALGSASNPQPCMLNHWRTRLDGQAAIYEALWDEATITIEAFRKALGAIFGVSWVTIGSSVNLLTFDAKESAVVTFSRTGTDYLRVVFFGYAGNGDWPSWMESGDEARGYLAANADEWEPVEV